MPITIYPYLIGPVWVFDDDRTGLKEEAFVCGMSEMISRLIDAKQVPNAATGFQLTFSDESFEGYDAELHWLRADEPESPMGGNWYTGTIADQQMQGWLCPALFCFFPAAPAKLFVRANQLPPGVDPIWHVDPNDSRQRRFMSAE